MSEYFKPTQSHDEHNLHYSESAAYERTLDEKVVEIRRAIGMIHGSKFINDPSIDPLLKAFAKDIIKGCIEISKKDTLSIRFYMEPCIVDGSEDKEIKGYLTGERAHDKLKRLFSIEE